MPGPFQPQMFSIDVGGTFTDCVYRPASGPILRHKVLSSGVTKGRADAGSDRRQIVDAARRADPDEFWNDYTLRLSDQPGRIVGESRVARFDRHRGVLHLAEDLPTDPSAGEPYELSSGEEAPIVAIRYLLGLRLKDAIPPVAVRLGTTRGTNALITRSGARTALVTTRGLADVLRIGYQNRPKLFELAVRKPEPLLTEVVEIDERITAEGEVLLAPDAADLRARLTALKTQNVESLAVCLLNA